ACVGAIGLPGAHSTLAHRVGSARAQVGGFGRLTVAGEVLAPGRQRRAHSAMRHGERSFHVLSVAALQPLGLSLWHPSQGLGMPSSWVSAGVMNLKVWARTFTSPIVCSICGM